MNMRGWVLLNVGVLAALLLVWLVVKPSDRSAYAAAARADSAQAFARAQLQVADSLTHVADSLRARQAEATASADTAHAQVVRLRKQLVALPAPPDTCRPFIAARDSIITIQASENDSLRTALDFARNTEALLGRAVQVERVVADTVVQVLHDMPKPRKKRHIDPAVFAGRCIGGSWCAGVGIAVHL